MNRWQLEALREECKACMVWAARDGRTELYEELKEELLYVLQRLEEVGNAQSQL